MEQIRESLNAIAVTMTAAKNTIEEFDRRLNEFTVSKALSDRELAELRDKVSKLESSQGNYFGQLTDIKVTAERLATKLDNLYPAMEKSSDAFAQLAHLVRKVENLQQDFDEQKERENQKTKDDKEFRNKLMLAAISPALTLLVGFLAYKIFTVEVHKPAEIRQVAPSR